jgi:hypothetical protein
METPEVFQILSACRRGARATSAASPITALDAQGGIQWPAPNTRRSRNERRLFEDGAFFTPDRREISLRSAGRCQAPDAMYPLRC